MDAIYPINPQALFFIEGTGQGNIGANWGDGFATDPLLIAQNGLSDPKPFFDALLSRPYHNQVVISPHVYPPSVTHETQNFTGKGLYNRLSNSFGYLTQPGYCSGSCKTYPVAIGEFGSRFTEANDIQSMKDFAKYLNDPTTDNRHHAIKNWFYWSWNPNSGDTGGLVEDNWLTILWNKIDYLATIGLKPWYTKAGTATKTGTLCMMIVPSTGLTKSDLKPFTVYGQSFAFSDFNLTVCKTLPIGSYTITPPQLETPSGVYFSNPQTVKVNENTATPLYITYAAAPTVVPTKHIEVTAEIGTAWQNDSSSGIYMNSMNLFVKNTSSNSISTPWNLTLINSSFKSVTSYWNIESVSIDKGQISGIVKKSSLTLSANGASIANIGMIITSTSPNFTPESVLINGKPVTIKIKQ
jgi:hypothetical protein